MNGRLSRMDVEQQSTTEERRRSTSAGYEACDWVRLAPTAMIG